MAPPRAAAPSGPAEADALAARPTRDPRDWAFTGLLVFTAVLFFRPQDQLPILSPIPFADISAILALLAMVMGRLGRGLPVTRITPELCGVAALAMMILVTAPFSIWPGGAIGTFTDVYAKVLLIFILMVNTLTTSERLHKFTTLLVVASAYISGRAVFDYARGIGLVENGRVTSAVGGMFQNPNDLALNMVAVLPLSVLVAIRARTVIGRLFAVFMGLLMIGAVTATQSRGGFVGLAVMVLILAVQLARRRPGVVAGGALLLLFALPFAPASYWERVASITDDSKDATGSREARRILLIEAWQTFLRFPVQGVGAGQFQNYNPDDRIEIWRETHNVVLQVAAEMGLLGLIPFMYLLWRAFSAGRLTRKLVRRASGSSPPRAWNRSAAKPQDRVISRDQAEYFETHAGALTAAIVGWFVCALFASVAYSWTFYYLLALASAPHVILAGRLAARTVPQRVPVVLAEARA